MGSIHNCFLRVSEFTSSFSDAATLKWSDIHLSSSTLTISLHQSKTDPFRRDHTLSISATNTSTCPVRALQQYSRMIPRTKQFGPLFSAGHFSPLSKAQVSNTLRHCYSKEVMTHNCTPATASALAWPLPQQQQASLLG